MQSHFYDRRPEKFQKLDVDGMLKLRHDLQSINPNAEQREEDSFLSRSYCAEQRREESSLSHAPSTEQRRMKSLSGHVNSDKQRIEDALFSHSNSAEQNRGDNSSFNGPDSVERMVRQCKAKGGQPIQCKGKKSRQLIHLPGQQYRTKKRGELFRWPQELEDKKREQLI